MIEKNEVLYRARKNARLPIYTIAHLLDISEKSYWLYEHGYKTPDESMRQEIARILNADVNELFQKS